MELIKEIKLELEDYIAFNLFHSKKKLYLSVVIFTITFALLTLVIGLLGSQIWFIYLIVGIVVVILMTLINVSSIKRISRKQFESSKEMQEVATVIINSAKVGQENTFGSIMYGWSDLYTAVESDNAVFLYCSKLQALIIPKRLLTQEEESILRQLINENLDEKKNKLKIR